MMLAVKMLEDVVLTQEQANYECGNVYSPDMIAQIEFDMVKALDYQMNFPVATDFFLHLLLMDQGQPGSSQDPQSL